jgi:hypothetical protein
VTILAILAGSGARQDAPFDLITNLLVGAIEFGTLAGGFVGDVKARRRNGRGPGARRIAGTREPPSAASESRHYDLIEEGTKRARASQSPAGAAAGGAGDAGDGVGAVRLGP